jgi:hypothetical protein
LDYQIATDEGEVIAEAVHRDIAETIAWGICYHKHFPTNVCLHLRRVKRFYPGKKTTPWVEVEYPGEFNYGDKEAGDVRIPIRGEIPGRTSTGVA